MNSLVAFSSLFLLAVLSAQGVNSASVQKNSVRVVPPEAIDNGESVRHFKNQFKILIKILERYWHYYFGWTNQSK